MDTGWTKTAVLAALLGMGAPARAQTETGACEGSVTAATVVPCALKASLVVRSEQDELAAAQGRSLAVSPLLPSNPTLSLSGARRSAGDLRATNWSATLSQELEIAGQRGLRRDAANAQVEAQRYRIVTAGRDVAADALSAYYDALAAREEQRLAVRLLETTDAVARAAHGRADQGLIAAVDADVADASRVRALRARLSAERTAGAALASLATLVGSDPAAGRIAVEGELAPLESLAARREAPAPDEARPELRTLDAERRASSLRASAFRRSRVPNPTLSAFVQNDGFDERVYGLGVSLPIPLPGNVGRTFNGEIAEAEAQSRRAATERERARRNIALAVTVSSQELVSRETEVRAFSPELLTNADKSLRALGQEVENGRLTVREAIVAQQSLIELLQSHVAARRAWCLAAVERARAAGIPLDKGAP